MAVYDSTDHQLGDYLLGQATGYAGNAYSSLGAEHFRYQQQQRDKNLRVRHIPQQAGPGILDEAFEAAGGFASEWAENIVEFLSSGFQWIPTWVGVALKLICVAVLLIAGVQFEFTGWALLLVTGSGWFAPRITAGLLKCSLLLSLSLLYISFMSLVVILGVSLVIGSLYLVMAAFT